jgi:hypothetical protein
MVAIDEQNPGKSFLENPETFESFAEAFAWLFDHGVTAGKTAARPWTIDSFAEALGATGLMGKHADHGTTIRDWRSGKSVKPIKGSFDAIAKVFFGDAPSDARNRFGVLWKDTSRGGAKRLKPNAPMRVADTGDSVNAWTGPEGVTRVTRVPRRNERLFDIAIDLPQGSRPPSFDLFASATPGLAPDSDGALKWRVGLRRFFLLDRSEGCQARRGASDVLAAHGVRREGRGWTVAPPREADELLRGDSLPKEEPLARMEHDGQADVMRVVLRAQCEDTDLAIVWDGKPEAISDKRLALIARFMQAGECDAEGVLFLGEASMTWPRDP